MIQKLFQANSPESKSLNGATLVASGVGTAIALDACSEILWFGQIVGAPTTGAAVFEVNDVASDYAGKWYPMDTFDVSNPVYTGPGIITRGAYVGLVFWGRWRLTTNFDTGNFVGHINGLLT